MAQFQPGQTKPAGSGRQCGTPNRRTRDLEEALRSANLDIVASLAELIPQLDPGRKADILLALLPFLYPKRKAINHHIADVFSAGLGLME